MRIRLIVFVLLSLFICGNSIAADYYVKITNRTGYTIMYTYVSPAKSKSWEEDVLGSDVLANGYTQRVRLRNYTYPIFDIRLVDEDGDTYTFWNVDVSRQDIVATIEDID